MEKFQYLIVGMGLSLVLIGLLAGGVVGQGNNSTVVNETTLPPQNGSDDYITMPNNTIEEPQEEVLSPSEQIAIREGEKAEEAAMSEEEPEQIEETDISPVETQEDPIVYTSIEEQIKPAVKVENKPIEQVETTKEITVRKRVNENGYVFVGKAMSGRTVEIRYEK